MPIVLAIVLGVVQALTEFLPVSSSGHLVVFQHYLEPIFGSGETPLAFDVLLHFATLLVVFIYLRRDILDVLRTIASSESSRGRDITLAVIVGTIPAVLVVLFLRDAIESAFHSVSAAAGGFLITACVLELGHRAQQRGNSTEGDEQWEVPNLRQALFIGLAQALAILPGVSRSGSTIASALLMGLPTESALRFSFLLAIPAIGGATILELGNISDQFSFSYLVGFIAAAVVGWGALRALVFVSHTGRLRWFGVYTAILGALLLLLNI